MLISKFDLYKSEWLELVFDDRNKAYGAYELRQHYPRTMAKVMAGVFLTIAAIGVTMHILIKPVVLHPPIVTMVPVVLHPYVIPPHVTPPHPITHVQPPAAPPAAVSPHVLLPFVPSPAPTAIEPPTVTQTTTGTTGPVTPGPVSIDDGGSGTTPGGTGTSPTPGPEAVYPANGIERMPEPYGGASAWSKFLNKHLKYPDMAIDAHQSGRVYVSFIVEKDGSLSNIVVDRGAGYGMDEEAVRVLKLAPAWKPGIQNGQPVRVKYNIPINFQMTDDN